MAIELNPVDALEEEASRATKKTPFIFSIKEGEKALVHALVNLPEAIVLAYHETWDDAKKTYAVSDVCAADPHIVLECQHCATAAATDDKKLAAKPRVFLPVYLHAVMQRVGDKWVTVTYRGSDDMDYPSSGLRVLELKGNIGKMMNTYYKESAEKREDRTLQASDYVIERMSRTEYAVSPKPAARTIPQEWVQKEWAQVTTESLVNQIVDLRGLLVVGDLTGVVAGSVTSNDIAF